MLVSVTRLRLRSLWFLLPFAVRASQIRKQAHGTPGCLGVRVRKTRGLAFWTLSLWEGEESLRTFLSQPPHVEVMPRLSSWCDEAATTHWVVVPQEMPKWEQATEQLLKGGRLLHVNHPSEAHRQRRISVT
jgi:heme-degrading monooxygenase HmoA